MYGVMSAWKDSLTLLKPKQAKLFALLTINAFVHLYMTWFRYFWWLALFYVACAGPEYSCPLAGSWLGCAVSWKLQYLGVLEVTMYLMGRSSVSLKNYRYCAQFFSLGYLIGIAIAALIYGICLYTMMHVAGGLVHVVLLCIQGLFLLFFLDSEGGMRAAWLSLQRALLLFVYALPLFLCVIAGALLTLFLGTMLFSFLGGGAAAAIFMRVLYVLSVPLLVSVVTNMYLKQVHDHFVRYFGEQRKGYHD